MKTVVSLVRLTVAAGVLAGLSLVSASPVTARERDGVKAPAERLYVQIDDDDNDDRRGRGRGRGGDDARPFIPLEYIIGQIQARTPGRLVGVRGPNGQGIYRIVWETPDGRVITFVVDGRTGQILR